MDTFKIHGYLGIILLIFAEITLSLQYIFPVARSISIWTTPLCWWGYIMLLDGVKPWFEDDCSYEWREKYEDPVYEGAYDYWECGSTGLYVVGVRPIEDPTGYLMLVEVHVTSDADFEALERIMATFDYYP